MAKPEDKKPRLSDADKLKSLKKKLKKLTVAVKETAASVEARIEQGAEAAVAAVTKPKTPVSPLAPAAFPDLPVIAGAEFASAAAGVKYKGRTDVMLVRLAGALPTVARRWRVYQTPTQDSTPKPTSAISENQLRLA